MAAPYVLMGREVPRRKISTTMIFACVLEIIVASEVEWGEHLLCRNCGHEVAKAADLVNVPSPHAIYQRNETIMGVDGVLIQLFKNPNGMHFEVFTTSSAFAEYRGQSYPADTWFEGYTWRLAKCTRCHVHLGWCYEPGERMLAKCTTCQDINTAIINRKRFFGFVVDKVIHQQCLDDSLPAMRGAGVPNEWADSPASPRQDNPPTNHADSLVMPSKFYGE